MAMKDISEEMLLISVDSGRVNGFGGVVELMSSMSGESYRVCVKKLEQAHKKDLIDYGVSIMNPWLTELGYQKLEAYMQQENK